MNPLIETENLSYRYDDAGKDEAPALHSVTMKIERGEYVAILGHNGSGKSTLAKLLNLLLIPTSGAYRYDGVCYTDHTLTDEEVYSLRRRVGMVFQNPDNQLVASVVEEDVAFGPENLGVPLPELADRVADSLERVGMTSYAETDPHRLSGGQKQRIAIAGILAMHPECILLDESTAMLDPGGRKELLETVSKLNREDGITVLNITHYMEEAAQADRILVINDGDLVMDGTPKEIFARGEELRKIGLEIPQCASLYSALDGKNTVVTEAECADAIYALWRKHE